MPRHPTPPPLTITTGTDPDGPPIVSITLPRSPRPLVLLADDYAMLQARGLASRIRVVGTGRGHSYPVVSLWGKATTLARVILGADPGCHVRYADGDSFNLRRSNLVGKALAGEGDGGDAAEAAEWSPESAEDVGREFLASLGTGMEDGLLAE